MSVTIKEVRNARSLNAENTCMDVEINHPEYGWIPYHLTDYDTCMMIDNNVLMGLIGSDFEPYVPPTPEALNEKASESIRRQRNWLLVNEVDPIVSNPLRWGDLTTEQQNAWSQYRTDLLNLTDQEGFPNNVTWPTKPE